MARAGTSATLRRQHFDVQDRVADPIQPGLTQQRHIEDGEAGGLFCLPIDQFLPNLAAYGRVEDLFHRLTRLVIMEDDRGKQVAVHAASTRSDRLAERNFNLGKDFRRLKEFADDAVGIDMEGVEDLTEALGSGALARPDSSGQAEQDQPLWGGCCGCHGGILHAP